MRVARIGGGRRRVTAVSATVLCVVLLAAAAIASTTHLVRGQARAGSPPFEYAPRMPVVAPGPARGLRASRPIRLAIPRIKVSTSLLSLGKNADGTLEVPSVARAQQAGWYRLGASPGTRGPAVIAGHVDSRFGPAVFHRLGELRRGDVVRVLRKDAQTAVFQIDSVERVHKDRFPTRLVYGDLAYPGLRLITCGGAFDQGVGQYTDNVIAYGHLVGVQGPAEPVPTLKPVRKVPSAGSGRPGQSR